ncbi:hypothetical protein Q7W37_08640 [Streptococcus suis]|nr:hypothetical protein [Streptococcus suis]
MVRAGSSGVGQAFAKLVRSQFPDMELVASVCNLAKEEQLLTAGFSKAILEKDGRLQTQETFTLQSKGQRYHRHDHFRPEISAG